MPASFKMVWFSRSKSKNSRRAFGNRSSWPLSIPADAARGLIAALYISLVVLVGQDLGHDLDPEQRTVAQSLDHCEPANVSRPTAKPEVQATRPCNAGVRALG